MLNLEQYKQDLVAREQALSARLGRSVTSAREPTDESAGDIGDESLVRRTEGRATHRRRDRLHHPRPDPRRAQPHRGGDLWRVSG